MFAKLGIRLEGARSNFEMVLARTALDLFFFFIELKMAKGCFNPARVNRNPKIWLFFLKQKRLLECTLKDTRLSFKSHFVL